MEFVVLGLLGLSIVMVAAAITGHRAAGRAQRQLERTTREDVLTGLPNRTSLLEALAKRLGAGPERTGGLVLIEVSRFASINDTYGREVGDGLLVTAADQLGQALRPGETLFRPGGPRFAVLIVGISDERALVARAGEIQEALQVPFRIGTDHVQISTTAGCALLDRRAKGADDVLHDATVALQLTYADEAEPTVMYTLSAQPQATGRSAERRLREALERNEFWVLYLPVVALDDNDLVGVEALLRWADPERGLVSPSQFLAMLDESGLIVPVGEWVIEQVCRQNVMWQQAFPDRDLITTINVSPRQLSRPDFLDRLLETVRDTGVDPTRLCLEITQGMMMRELESSWGTLRLAKDAGIKLALDDFGTGYSSLTYLRSFSLDVLKIDRTFVKDIATSREDAAIAQQLVALAHALDLAPVAEGIDSAEQAQTLHGMGCEYGQGYFFAPPQPVTAIDHMLTRGKIAPAAGQSPTVDWTAGG